MNKTVVDLLTDFKQVAAAWQKDRFGDKANKILQDLRDLLKDDEWSTIFVARNHYLTGEGRQELDRECNALIQKYRHDPPDPRKRTLL